MKKIKSLDQIPKFKSEEEEREFWDTHSFEDLIEQAERIKFERPTMKVVSVRLDPTLRDEILKYSKENKVKVSNVMREALRIGLTVLIHQKQAKSKNLRFPK